MDKPGVCTSERLRPNVGVGVCVYTTVDKIINWLKIGRASCREREKKTGRDELLRSAGKYTNKPKTPI